MLEISTAKKTLEFKFSLKALMKVNSEHSTIDDGKSNGNGGALAFVQLINGNDEMLISILKSCATKPVSENELLNVIEDYIIENDTDYAQLFDLVTAEMKNSAFFGKKIRDMKKQMEKQKEMIMNKEEKTLADKEFLESADYTLQLMTQEK